ncbi:MAG: hybrid sensor histidine kinase/response regulator [Candidatus Lindowbacteria bacterium]|nr:hybrid sensor histidine kinase/response regulator [Candidatus Lindowbacteria bacterium]
MESKDLPWVLIVDDDEKNLHATKRVLEDLEIGIDFALSGEDALKAIIKKEYFLILMDVQMPGMDGFETVSLIRNNKNHRALPIIFLTAISKEDRYVQAGYDEGAVDYLCCTVNPHILVSKVKIFLEMQLNKRELKTQLDMVLALTKELYDANDKLKGLDEMKNYFVRTVAHELRTPLSAIYGAVENLLEGYLGEISERQTKTIEIIRKSTQRLVRLIEDLLDLSKIESGNFEIEMSQIDIRDSIRNAAQSMSSVFTENNKKLDFTLPETPVLVDGNGDKITQILLNLFGNASRFAKEKVSVYLGGTEDAVCIVVEDDGCGIPENRIDSLFKPFSKIPEYASRSQTGLGLSITRGLVEAHGGRIWVENRSADETSGARFVVELPRSGKKNFTVPCDEKNDKIERQVVKKEQIIGPGPTVPGLNEGDVVSILERFR